MKKRDYIKLIHIARNITFRCPACGKLISKDVSSIPVCSDCAISMVPMTDEDYRKLLLSLTGKESAKFLDEEELEKVYMLFKSCGFNVRTKANMDLVEQEYQDGRKKTIGIILSEAKRTLGPSWKHRLDKFVASKNNGETVLYRLPDNQLRQVLGWIRRNAKAAKSDFTF